MTAVAERDSPDSRPPERAQAESPALKWLRHSAMRVDALAGVLVFQQGTKTRIEGAFPAESQPPLDLVLAARRAFANKAVIAREAESEVAHVAYALRISGRPAVVALSITLPPDEDDQAALSRIASQVLRREEDQPAPNESTLQKPAEAAAQERARPEAPPPPATAVAETFHSAADLTLIKQQGLLIESMASMLDQDRLSLSLHELANRLQTGFRCLRVTIGLWADGNMRVEAMSREANFDQRSALVVDIAEAMTETASAATTLSLPALVEDHAPPQAHVALATVLKGTALLSVPLVADDAVVGVVLLERDIAFDNEAAEALERIALALSPIVALQQIREMGLWQRARQSLRHALGDLVGPRFLKAKAGLAAMLALIAWTVATTDTFQIDADAAIEARSQRALVATFPSFLTEVDHRAGDVVNEGDVIARLDTEEISLDRIKWEGELDKLRKEYRANLAQRDRSKVRILEAQILQAQNQLNLIDAQLERAVLRAPIDGVIIAGDWAQALGKPVERGEKLFEIATLSDFDLTLRVDEADIGWVDIGYQGALRLESLPDQLLNFEVTGITPVSEAGDGRNLFRVDAALLDESAAIRPGMKGIAKVAIEERSLAWIWTREFWNWLRLKLWQFGGL